MRTAAILPVKRFCSAKQRLGESVSDGLRGKLARAMVGDVLSALRECQDVDATVVVTCETTVMAAARYLGALVVEDTAESGQSAAVSLGVARALAEGFERAVCVPGDCPALDPAELSDLLAAAAPGRGPDASPGTERGCVAIVPDRHGSGTNALVLTPPDAIEPSFGPGSRARHEQLAQAADTHWLVLETPSLLLDIDTGEDLAVLRERLAGERVRAPRTRAVLARSAPLDGGVPQAA